MKQKGSLYLLFFVLLFPVIALCNENFKLIGYLNENFNGCDVNLYINRDTTFETLNTTVTNGKFFLEFTPKGLYEHCILSLWKDKIFHQFEFFLSGKDIEIKLKDGKTMSLKENPFKNCSYEGVFFTDFIEGYHSPLEVELDSLNRKLDSRAYRHSPKAVQDSINNLAEQKRNELFRYRLKFIKNHASYYPSLTFLKEDILRYSAINADSLASLFSIFPPELQQTDLGEEILERIKKKMSIMIGKEAPEIDVVDLNDSTYKLNFKNMKGNYTLLCFWASWCKPCIKNIFTLKEFDSLYAPSGLKLISVSVDRKKSDWKMSAEKYNMPWLQLLNPFNSKGSAIYTYAYGVPQYYLIDPTAKIIYNNVQLRDSEDCETLKYKLKKIFK